MKSKFVFVFMIILAIILSACGTNSSNEFDVSVAVSLTQTAAAPALEQPTAVPAAEESENSEEPAILKGTVHLPSPPTPSMIVYAMDPDTGQWATMQTEASDLAAPFELYVPAGHYIVYAFSEDGGTYLGYPNAEDTDLALIEVAFGETIENITVRPPGPWDCGLMWGVPDAPDGRFAGYSASETCMNSYSAGSEYVVPSADLCQMIEGIAQETLGVPFELNMMDSFTDIVAGESGSGCTMLAQVTEDQLTLQNDAKTDLMNALIGWEEDPMYMVDGGTGTGTGLRRDMALMLLTISWLPVESADCPDNQPISACELTPDQKLYTIEIKIGMK